MKKCRNIFPTSLLHNCRWTLAAPLRGLVVMCHTIWVITLNRNTKYVFDTKMMVKCQILFFPGWWGFRFNKVFKLIQNFTSFPGGDMLGD